MRKETPEGTTLTAHVQPKAARTEFVGVHGDALKFRVAAPPIEGAANEALCAYLAERFGIPGNAVVLLAGRGSRRKRLLLRGVSPQRVEEVFGCRAQVTAGSSRKSRPAGTAS